MSIKEKSTEYDFCCNAERERVLRRFLPYATSAPEDFSSRKALHRDPLTGANTDQSFRGNFVFFSDSHIDFYLKEESFDNVKRTIEFANSSPVKFDAILHGGDIITQGGILKKEEAKAYALPFFEEAKKSRSPFIFTKGNHDNNDWGNLPENAFDEEDFGEMFLDFAEENYGIKRQTKKNGKKSTWHYFDVEDKKIRVVAVDVQDTDKTVADEEGKCLLYGSKSWYVSEEQMNWIISDALSFDEKEEKDWGVIFLLHQEKSVSEYHENAMEKLLSVCEAFNEGKTYSHSYENKEFPFLNLKIEADFTRYKDEEKRPHMICWLVGHEHEDMHFKKKGINIIYILNGSATIAYSDPRVARIPGTATQNCFDILNVDTYHRRIRMFRYGAGMTCFGKGGDRFLPDGLEY